MSPTSVAKPWGNRIVVGTSCLTAAVLLLANWPAVQGTLTVFWETGVPAELIQVLAGVGGISACGVMLAKVWGRFEARRRERAELVALRIVVQAMLDSVEVNPAVFRAARAKQWAKAGQELTAQSRSLAEMALWSYTPRFGKGGDGD